MVRLPAMDETLILAHELLNDVLKAAKSKNACHIKEIHIDISEVIYPDNKRLLSSFRLLSEGTIAEKAAIKVKRVDGVDCHVRKIVIK
jgi:Zn finger protein HypA/HybF involved in hydrogenase expression